MPPPLIQTHNPKSLYSSTTYSPLVTVDGRSRLIYTAGQVGRDSSGYIPKNYEDQVKLAYQNLRHCLAAVDATPKNIVKLTYYVVNYDPNRRTHVKITEDFLEGHRPGITLIPVQQLAAPEFLFEVEAVAAVGLDESSVTDKVVNKIDILSHAREVDAIVVGGGVSGLRAAHQIQKAGFSSIVLEARNRVGGKLLAVDTLEKTGGDRRKGIDLGGAWINDSNQWRAYSLARELGLDIIEQATAGDCIVQQSDGTTHTFAYGDIPKISPEYQKEVIDIRDAIENMCRSVSSQNAAEYDKISMEDFAQTRGLGKAALENVTLWTRAMLGCEPSEMSALYFLEYCQLGGGLKQMRSDQKHGGQYLRVRQGMGSLATGLASKLRGGSVILNSPVSRVIQELEKVIVTTHSGISYRCKKVIFSLPTPLYKDVVFEPQLPPTKLSYSSGTKLGYYAKVILLYEAPWWKDRGFCGLTHSFKGPASLTRDTSSPKDGQYSLTCFVVGEPGRKWSLFSQAERHSQILNQIVSIYGPQLAEEIKRPLCILEQDWSREEYSRGCPCPVTEPGILSRFGKALQVPFGNVHFVGTETGRHWKGYIEGALESGDRGAEEVIQSLSNDLLSGCTPKI